MKHGRMMLTKPVQIVGLSKSIRIWSLFAVSLLLLSLVGCGDGRGLRIPVSGNVSIDGKPIEFGSILFKPSGAPQERPGGGSLGAGGAYGVSIYTAYDGLPPGKYDVAITATEPLGETAQRWHAPMKYSDSAKSGLTAEIDKSTKEVNFELTWDGNKRSAPFVEKF